MSIGKRIQEERKKRGMTQAQLAEKVGLSTITIRQYENDKREPRHQTMEKIADALNITTLDLFNPTYIYRDSEGNELPARRYWSEVYSDIMSDVENLKKKALSKMLEDTLDQSLIESLLSLREEELKYVQAYVDGLKARRNENPREG